MITIDQLLESVDLDFEPRWVTMNAFGVVAVRSGEKPHPESPKWIGEIKKTDKGRNRCGVNYYVFLSGTNGFMKECLNTNLYFLGIIPVEFANGVTQCKDLKAM